MAEEIESPTGENTETGVTRRSGRQQATPKTPRSARTSPRRSRPAPTASAATAPSTPSVAARRSKLKPLRSLVILSVVGGLVAAIALPTFSPKLPTAEAMTLQQAAVDDAQTLVVASDAESATIAREGYTATTQEEIDKKKAEEAAAARARTIAAARGKVASVNMSMTAPGSGEVRYPLATWSAASYNMFRPAGRPNHNGLDMMAPSGSAIFAAAAGVVRSSTDSGGSYGAVVVIDSVVGGQAITTRYAHMTYGTRAVSAGQTVEAGQFIGQVGQTGNATAPHCHFEVMVGGGYVDPLAWLQANAG